MCESSLDHLRDQLVEEVLLENAFLLEVRLAEFLGDDALPEGLLGGERVPPGASSRDGGLVTEHGEHVTLLT